VTEKLGPGSAQSILQHWRDSVPNDRLAHLVRDAARGLARALQMRLVKHHVTFGHWAFLRILWDQDGLTQRELSDRAGVMEPTTYAAVTAMEKLGYVTRENMPGNKKNNYVRLTAKGRALQAKLVPEAEEVNRISIRGVSAKDVAITRQTLLAMIQNLAADEAAAMQSEERRNPSTQEIGRLIQRGAPRKRARRAG
jgi:DNA-binding MarR family transcriptional regulator